MRDVRKRTLFSDGGNGGTKDKSNHPLVTEGLDADLNGEMGKGGKINSSLLVKVETIEVRGMAQGTFRQTGVTVIHLAGALETGFGIMNPWACFQGRKKKPGRL